MATKLNPNEVIGHLVEPTKTVCTDRDAILYALGIGFSTDPLNEDDLQYTYERHDDFKVFPTFSTCIHKCDIFQALLSCKGLPEFNPMMLLHGEQQTIQVRPLAPEGKYMTRGSIVDVADKGKGALVTMKIDTFEVDSQGKEHLSATNISSCFIRGIGGFGFKGVGGQREEIAPHPKRNADKVVNEKTQANQAIIYRLSGDYNPLHIDKNMSAMGGFDVPILHGLCSYGVTAKIIIQTYCKGDQSLFKSISARFTSHVFPGETLSVQMWKEGSRIHYATKTLERGIDTVIGHVDIHESAKL